MEKIKVFCSTHRYYYNGNECPFCREERIKALNKRFNCDVIECKEENNMEKSKDREITKDDLDKLVNKFKR